MTRPFVTFSVILADYFGLIEGSRRLRHLFSDALVGRLSFVMKFGLAQLGSRALIS